MSQNYKMNLPRVSLVKNARLSWKIKNKSKMFAVYK